MRLQGQLKALHFIITCFLVCGCSSTSIPTISFGDEQKLEELEFSIKAESDINPDQSGRPSPLVITIYQLTSDVNFSSLDAYSLVRDGDSLLGADLKNKTQVTVFPGQELEPELKINKETQYVGFLAAFQDIDNARSKIVFKVESTDPDDICLSVSNIQLTPQKSC